MLEQHELLIDENESVYYLLDDSDSDTFSITYLPSTTPTEHRVLGSDLIEAIRSRLPHNMSTYKYLYDYRILQDAFYRMKENKDIRTELCNKLPIYEEVYGITGDNFESIILGLIEDKKLIGSAEIEQSNIPGILDLSVKEKNGIEFVQRGDKVEENTTKTITHIHDNLFVGANAIGQNSNATYTINITLVEETINKVLEEIPQIKNQPNVVDKLRSYLTMIITSGEAYNSVKDLAPLAKGFLKTIGIHIP